MPTMDCPAVLVGGVCLLLTRHASSTRRLLKYLATKAPFESFILGSHEWMADWHNVRKGWLIYMTQSTMIYATHIVACLASVTSWQEPSNS